jgi:hypothetical protein
MTDTDAKAYQSQDPHKVLLATQELDKRKKYLQACLEQHHPYAGEKLPCGSDWRLRACISYKIYAGYHITIYIYIYYTNNI